MGEHLLEKLPVLVLVPCAVKAYETAAPLQTVASHLELVHGVNVLHMALDRGAVGRTRGPHVEVLVTPSLKVHSVGA
jgi:hypothetical protein